MGVLLAVRSFLGLYNRDGVESVGLDDAANKLGIRSDLFLLNFCFSPPFSPLFLELFFGGGGCFQWFVL